MLIQSSRDNSTNLTTRIFFIPLEIFITIDVLLIRVRYSQIIHYRSNFHTSSTLSYHDSTVYLIYKFQDSLKFSKYSF